MNQSQLPDTEASLIEALSALPATNLEFVLKSALESRKVVTYRFWHIQDTISKEFIPLLAPFDSFKKAEAFKKRYFPTAQYRVVVFYSF